jgi:broad specificity phosphatase PhoE
MTVIYLLRHGDADYEPVRERQWPGSMADLAPLSRRGEQQAMLAAQRLSAVGASMLVSSPFTRTMQTASIVSCHLQLRIEVEFGLHEWVPDDTFSWLTHDEVLAYVDDFDSWGGEWPVGERKPWEPLSAVRRRSSAALRAAAARMPADGGALIAVCHEMVIRSLTGAQATGRGEFRRIDLADLEWVLGQ